MTEPARSLRTVAAAALCAAAVIAPFAIAGAREAEPTGRILADNDNDGAGDDDAGNDDAGNDRAGNDDAGNDDGALIDYGPADADADPATLPPRVDRACPAGVRRPLEHPRRPHLQVAISHVPCSRYSESSERRSKP